MRPRPEWKWQGRHETSRCKTCGPFVNSPAFGRGVERAKREAADRYKETQDA